MRNDLGVRLFDIELLAAEGDKGSELGGLVPGCPMMTYGWSLLNAKGIHLREPYLKAMPYLIPSTWTSFSEKGIDIILAALRDGELD